MPISSKALKSAFLYSLLCVLVVTAITYAFSLKQSDLADTPYEIAKPHFGPLIKTTPVMMTFEKGHALFQPDPEQLGLIKKHQNVILFDKTQNILPLGGVVKAITKDGEKTTAQINLPKGTDTFLLSAEGHLIHLETTASKRLPVSALQTDEDGTQFIWKVTSPNEPKSALEKVIVTNPLIAPPLFDPQDKNILAFHQFVITPDATLSEENMVAIESVKINAPLQNPIREARRNFEKLLKLQDYEDMRIAAENCGKTDPSKSTTNSSTADNSSCGGDGPDMSNMPEEFQLFYSLINNPENTGN